MGNVEEIFPRADNLIYVADVRTTTVVLRKPISKLILLVLIKISFRFLIVCLNNFIVVYIVFLLAINLVFIH